VTDHYIELIQFKRDTRQLSADVMRYFKQG